MMGRRVLGGILAIAVVVALVWGFLALDLTSDQQVGFLGAAFGSFAAAATALGVIEFQAKREADHLLFDATTIAQDYLDRLAPTE